MCSTVVLQCYRPQAIFIGQQLMKLLHKFGTTLILKHSVLCKLKKKTLPQLLAWYQE